jgi:hypothetical protein
MMTDLTRIEREFVRLMMLEVADVAEHEEQLEPTEGFMENIETLLAEFSGTTRDEATEEQLASAMQTLALSIAYKARMGLDA